MNTRDLFDRIERDLADDQRLLGVFRTYIERSERNRQEFLDRVAQIIDGDRSPALSSKVLDEIKRQVSARDFN